MGNGYIITLTVDSKIKLEVFRAVFLLVCCAALKTHKIKGRKTNVDGSSQYYIKPNIK